MRVRALKAGLARAGATSGPLAISCKETMRTQMTMVVAAGLFALGVPLASQSAKGKPTWTVSRMADGARVPAQVPEAAAAAPH
jgi:hypothetical protein